MAFLINNLVDAFNKMIHRKPKRKKLTAQIQWEMMRKMSKVNLLWGMGSLRRSGSAFAGGIFELLVREEVQMQCGDLNVAMQSCLD